MNWRRFFQRDDEDDEQREELEFYLDLTAEENIHRGMSPPDARAAARRKLGNATLVREEIYLMNTLTWVESAVRDVRHALRMIRTKPGFSVPALLSLALGIGANIAIFSIVNGVLIRPLPYPDPEALVGVFSSSVFQGQAMKNMPLSLGMYRAYRDSARTFQEFGVWTEGAATITGTGDPEQVAEITMTEGVLPALGIRPYLGRWFSKQDDTPGTAGTVILSNGFWQRKFGGDPRILGQTVLIDFVPYQVIGIMPRSFQFLNLAPDVLLPQRPGNVNFRSDEYNHSGIARLRPGVTLSQANQDGARILGIWGDQDGVRQWAQPLRFRPELRPLKQDVVGDIGSVLGILMGALVLVLLLVCANVANLVQVRAQARSQEFAIRAALGAGWRRIARELLVECLTVGLLGGMLGLGLAFAGVRLMTARGSALIPRLGEISIDATSILFGLVCCLGSSLLFGLIAALSLDRRASVPTARGASAGTRPRRTQDALVMSQVAFAVMLLIAAGLMLRSFIALRAITPGFTRAGQVQTARILIPEAQVQEPDRVARMQADILARIAAIPGVTSAAFSSALPLETEYRNGNSVDVEGRTPPGEIPANRVTKRISPGLFATLGTRFLAGRDFTWNEVFSQARVAIVSENMARENWGEPHNALGKRLRLDREGPWTEVIGVVENIHDDGVDREAPATVYLRAGVSPPSRPGGPAAIRRAMTFAIRSDRAGTESFLHDLSAAVHAVDPDLPLAKIRTLNAVYRQSMARTSFVLALLLVAGTMALTLAIIGVYGVLAYAVNGRRREIGIRVALGAEPQTIRTLFLRQGLILTAAGSVIGVTAAAGISRWISALLFGITPLDPTTYAVSTAMILAAAMTASYIPAFRAAAVNPMDTLRAD